MTAMNAAEGAEALVTASLHDFEEKPFIKRARVDLKEFAGIIAIIQNLVFSHTCCDGGIEPKSALNVVIIIVWDFQKRCARGTHSCNRLENVIAFESDVLNSRAKKLRQEARRHGPRCRRSIKNDTECFVRAHNCLALYKPERVRNFKLR